jgi:hypothetical protein
VGYSTGAGGVKTNAIYYFTLPDTLPTNIVGAHFMTSSLPDDGTNTAAPVAPADLWALGFDNNVPPITHGDATANAAAQNYYHDNDTPDTDGGTPQSGVFRLDQKIHDDFLIPAEWVANGGTPNTQETDLTADVALLAYIQSLYLNPNFIPGQSSLILRVNPQNLDLSGNKRYNLSSAESLDAGAVLPTLTLDVVPEPSAAVLASLAALGLLKRRR